MQDKIVILDFGSQYTQLIARKVRELNVYCDILPFSAHVELRPDVKGVILSGSPFSVLDDNAPHPDIDHVKGKVPMIGVCYGAQYLSHHFGGNVAFSNSREYGRALLKDIDADSILMKAMEDNTQVWMSHGDTILEIPDSGRVIASTEDVRIAAFQLDNEPTYGLQFHPEVYHSTQGKQLLSNFVVDICKCSRDWTPENFIETTVIELREKLGGEKVVLGLSGGVDSSVAAMLLTRAVGEQLSCIFVDNGLLRKNEFESVLDSYKDLGLNVIGVDARQRFWDALKGVSEPEQKRKIIGGMFIEVFDEEAHKIQNVKWLAQGTIYPDVIESVSVNGPSVTIKSHHNVGGLPAHMKLEVVEPLRLLFKDEVRRVGRTLGLPEFISSRHPFPVPGLAIRILGDITPEKVRILQEDRKSVV